jgi:hypothetical protein
MTAAIIAFASAKRQYVFPIRFVLSCSGAAQPCAREESPVFSSQFSVFEFSVFEFPSVSKPTAES